MIDGVMFTAANVFVFADPYLKLMDGESGKCEGYMPKKATENLLDVLGEKSKAFPEWVSSWFNEESKRHFISLSWQNVELREKFVKAFDALPESERCGIVRNEECEKLDAEVAEDLNEKARKEEEERSLERKAWFEDQVNADLSKRVAVVKGTCQVDEKTGRAKLDPEEGQFIENLIKFMNKSDQPEDIAFLGHDDDGKFWIAYSFRLDTLRNEFERRVNCNAKKPDGISFVSEGPVYEELVMSIVKRNVFRKENSEALSKQVDAQEPKSGEEVFAPVAEPEVDPTEEFHATEADKAE